MLQQVAMFRKHGLGDCRTLLVELSKDPAMIFWLDNQENTNDVHNENYGRELLELFSMGIGNYTEDDVKDCARAFTGWTLKNPIPGAQPFGRPNWQFEFRPTSTTTARRRSWRDRQLGRCDIVDIIVKQPACAQFIAMRLHNYFVSDVPDQAAIDELAEVFVSSQYDIRPSCGRCSCRTPSARWTRTTRAVKSPAEHVAASCG
jgi:uncharacterized protein (DUF1800 family)